MNTRQVVSGLVAIVALAIAFVVGRQFQSRQFQSPTGCPKNYKCITISKESGGKCQVDFPVVNMNYNHHVQWFSADDKYSVSFLNVQPPSGSPPLPSGYVPKSPLVPYEEPVIIPANGNSTDFNVKHQKDFYLYAIFDLTVDPSSSNPCKASTDDSDTRLNVKP
jgi:hypothetical protein